MRQIQQPKNPNFQIDYNDFKNATQIQNFINKQLWLNGNSYTSQVGTTNTNVKWGGQSRFLCGFIFFSANPNAHQISITLNNEKMIDSANMVFLYPLGNIKFMQYYEFIRPLSGSDTLVVTDVSTVSEQVDFGLYMTRAYNKRYVYE